jgi:CysZ protein
MALGLLPGLLTIALFTVAIATLIARLGPTSEWIAERIVGESPLRDAVALLAGVSLLGASALIVVYTFTATTLFIGQPFFERISQRVDSTFGDFPEADAEPWWKATIRGLLEGVRLLLLSAVIALTMLGLSFIPGVGTAIAFTLGASIGGWFLALELTAYPLSRRGIVRLRDRRKLLARHRPVVMGFGAAVYIIALLPGGAVFIMPSAVAGAVLLTRHVLGDSLEGEFAVNRAIQGGPSAYSEPHD